jgi:proteasome lid subunit RPN8/RPN11
MTGLDIRALDEKELRTKPFPKVKQDFRVYIGEAAFDAAVARGDADTTREVGGVLVGEVLRDADGPYLLVEATIDALHAEEKGAELTFTHSTWEHIHKEMDSRFAGKKVVGWYHTHPGFGVFLSDRDQFIHKSFFNLPFQVALVYDPKSRAHGVFGWHANETWRSRRYWIGANEHHWDGPRTTAAPTQAPSVPPPSPPPSPTSVPAPAFDRSESVTLGIIGLVLALVAGGFGWWLGSRDSAGLVNSLQMEVLRSQQEGARQAVASLDAELVGLLRSTLGDEAVQRPLDEILVRLGEATVALTTGADDGKAQALAKILVARDAAVRLRDSRAMAKAVLARLEVLARTGSTQAFEKDLSLQKAALGQLYLELAGDAAKAGDMKRARRYLMTAATVDPANRARYEKEPL